MDRQDCLFLQLLHGAADEAQAHAEQQRRRRDEHRPQGQPHGEPLHGDKQAGKNGRRRTQAQHQPRGPATRLCRQGMDEQHRLAALAKHRQERDQAQRPARALRQRLVGACLEFGRPGAGILPQEQPAAHIEHQRGGHDHDGGFQPVIMRAIQEQFEGDGRGKARQHADRCAGIQHRNRVFGPGPVQDGGKRGNDQESLEALAQQDAAGLDGSGQVEHGKHLLNGGCGMICAWNNSNSNAKMKDWEVFSLKPFQSASLSKWGRAMFRIVLNNSELGDRGGQPFMPPAVSPPTTRSWKTAIRIEIGTMATISAAEMIGQGNENSPW